MGRERIAPGKMKISLIEPHKTTKCMRSKYLKNINNRFRNKCTPKTCKNEQSEMQ